MRAKHHNGRIFTGRLAEIFVRKGRATVLTDKEEKELEEKELLKAMELEDRKAKAASKGKNKPKGKAKK